MPIYECRCRECGERFDALLPVEDDGKLLFCPECAAKAPEKLAPIKAGTGPRDRGPDSTD
jgi:putative FmdB family regulatory protein